MVCKKDVVNWFKNSKSYKRIDVMCTLLNMCVPIELRFLGTCLEHLGKRDFHELRPSENEANNSTELNLNLDGQGVSSQHFRTKLAVYISVLHSCNYASSEAVYKILTKTADLSPIVKGDEATLDDILLLYTLALNHPAFSFEQKLTLEQISSHLEEEERRLSRKSNSQPAYTQDVEKAEPPMQAYHPACISMEDGHLISVASPQMGPMPPVPHHPGEQPVSVHEGGGIRLSYPPPATQIILNTGTWTMVGPPGASAGAVGNDSPLASRTSSPCSRPGSPVPVPSSAPRSSFPPPRVPPPPVLNDAAAGPDAALRETIGKELPKYVTSLQAYSSEQLIRMSDDELREIGLTMPAIGQLRSILAPKQHVMTNGIGLQQQHIIELISPQGPVPKKKDQQEPEVMRRYPLEGVAMYPAPPFMCHQPPHHTACFSCYTIPGGRKTLPLHYMAPGPPPAMPPHFPPMNNAFVMSEGFRSLRLGSSGPPEDHTSSDTGSDHSPPDTPAPANQGSGGMPVAGGELPNEERLGVEERRGGSRRGGIARSRANPPGVQSAPRGRGGNTVNRRRDMSGHISNGNSSTSSNASGSNGGGNGGNEPPGPGVAPGSYFGYMTAPYIRPPYPYPHPAAYVRHGPYPAAYHNGTELVYHHQYPPPGTPGGGPPPPPPGTFIPGPPPPAVPQFPQPPIMKQLSCYNCGSQSHQAADCPDPTIEEVTKQGQYRIDFAAYSKHPEADK